MPLTPRSQRGGNGPDSTWEQFKDVANPVNLAEGLGRFAWEAGRDFSRLPNAFRDAGARTGATLDAGGSSRAAATTFGASLQRDVPMAQRQVADIIQAPQRPVQFVQSLAPGGEAPSDTYYGRASEEGRILPVLLQDVGNLALVGGVAAKGLTAAGGVGESAAAAASRAGMPRLASAVERATVSLEPVARTTARISRAGDRISNPSTVWGAPSRMAGHAIEQAGVAMGRPGMQVAGHSLREAGVLRQVWGDVAARADRSGVEGGSGSMLLAPVRGVRNVADIAGFSRRSRPFVDESGDVHMEQANRVGEQIVPLEKITEELGDQAAVIERAALLTNMRLLDPKVLPSGVELSPDVLAEQLRLANPMDATPEAVEMARAYAAGTLAPEVAAKVDKARGVYDEVVVEPETARFLEGEGQVYDLTPEKKTERLESVEGTDYLTVARKKAEESMDESIKSARAKVDELEQTIKKVDDSDPLAVQRRQVGEANLAAARTRAIKLESTRDTAVAAALRADVNAAPSRYRPLINFTRQLSRHVLTLADEMKDTNPDLAKTYAEAAGQMATDLERIVAAGIDPKYVIGGTVADKSIDLTIDVPVGLREEIGVPDVGAAVAARRNLAALEERVQADPASVTTNELAAASAALSDAGVPDAAAFDRAVEGWLRRTGNGYMHAGDGVTVELAESKSGRGALTYRESPATPQGRQLAQTQMRKEGATPLTFEGQARNLKRRIAVEAENRLARFAGHQSHTPESLGVAPGLRGKAAVSAARQYAREKYGYDVVAWDPMSKAYAELPAELYDPAHTVFMPKWMFDSMRATWGKPMIIERALDAVLGKPTDWFKIGALAYSPRWHLGNAVGGFLLAMVAGDVSPLSMLAHKSEAWAMAKQMSEAPGSLPAAIQRLSSPHPNTAAARYIAGDTAKPQGWIRRGADASFRFNEKVDNFWKSTAYITNKSKGYTDAQAVRLALDALPDFRGRWWEDRIAKVVVPFYPWLANITRISTRLAIDHPLRVAWYLALADKFGDDFGIESYEGAMPIGDPDDEMFVQLGSLNPFAGFPQLNPLDMGGNINPFIKLGIAATTGIDVADRSPLTRPRGTGWTTAMGGDSGTPLLADLLHGNPGPLLYQGMTISPQTRALRDLVIDPVERYETGHPYRSGSGGLGSGNRENQREQVQLPGGINLPARLSGVVRLAGVPLPTHIEREDMLRVREERRRRAAEARAAYAG